jgi:hypothetical protein
MENPAMSIFPVHHVDYTGQGEPNRRKSDNPGNRKESESQEMPLCLTFTTFWQLVSFAGSQTPASRLGARLAAGLALPHTIKAFHPQGIELLSMCNFNPALIRIRISFGVR